MACLDALSVSGIRSFDPDDRAIIKFFPLTLILGANGAGKTTLIECLRYSATNEFPPHTVKGKTWIHDLHFAKGHTIRGQVKLAFKDIHGEKCVVTRSLELTAKRDRSGKVVPQMRTLDAVIKRGDESIVSTKCVQIDSVMLDLLGVSKAVLSDVIFCHQEDSNWPLSESKVLKEKFDQLFGSAGYVKALKKIKDERTEYQKRLALCEGELKLYQEHKSQADKYNNDLERNKLTLANYKEKMNTLDSELKPIRKDLEALALKEKMMLDVEKVISSLETELKEHRKSISYLEKNIREKFTGSKEELIEEMNTFTSKTSQKEAELKSTERKITNLEDKQSRLNANLNKISITKGQLEAKRGKFITDKNKFNGVLQKLLNERLEGLEFLSSVNIESNPEAALAEVQNSIHSHETGLEKRFKEAMRTSEAHIKEVDVQLDRFKSKKSKLEQSIQTNADQMMEKSDEADLIDFELKGISESSSQLKILSSDLAERKAELGDLEKQFDPEKLAQAIKVNRAEQSKLQVKLDQLNKEKDILIAQNEARAVLQVHLGNKEKEQDNLTNIYSEHVSLMQDLDIDENDMEKSFIDELKNKIRTVERKLKTKEANKETFVSDRRKLEMQLGMDKIELERCKKDIKEKEAKVKSLCGSTPFEKIFEETEAELKVLRSKSAISQGAETILSEYSVIIENEAKCPVCETDLKSNRTKVRDSLVKKIKQLPTEAKKVNEELTRKEEFFEKLLRLKSENEAIGRSKESLPKLKQDVHDGQKKLDEITAKIQSFERELKKERAEFERLRLAEPQAISYDNSVRSLQTIESLIKKCKEELGTVDDDLRSIDDVREEIEENFNEKVQLEEECKKLQDQKDEATERIGQVKEEVFALEGKKLNIEKGQQRQVALRDKCDELREQVNKLKKESINYESEINSMGPELKKLAEKRKTLIDQKETKRNEFDSLMAKLNRFLDEFNAIGEDISTYLMDDCDSELTKLAMNFSQIQEEICSINSEKSNLSKVCHKLREDINAAELGERNLKDNFELLQKFDKVTSVEAKLDKEMEKRGASDAVSLQKKKQSLERQFNQKNQELQQIKGRQEPIVSVIHDLERELSAEKYRKAKENYQSKLIEAVEMEIISDDLNKLYKALDHSVMVFHKKKMDEINRYLYNLWKQAYRGNDIDYIKIVSDTETERSASDKRRSFNYRVVMVLSRVEMDMRGRCSAGQKVIASLVIRLALAEIFSINCGILALDEPTTNLDRENIQAFADSVTNIVKLHRHHRFQLVIITHDDQFLRCLRESECEHYYEVFKDDKGYSKIKVLQINERED